MTRLPVFMYHNVRPPTGTAAGDANGEPWMDPVSFRRQVEWLAKRGYRGITLPTLLAWIAGNEELPRRSLMLTFDDAYVDIGEHALPLLEEMGFGATIFVVTDQIGGHNVWDVAHGTSARRVMSAAELCRWRDRGIDFGAHSRTHPDLTKLSEAQLEDEVAGSRRILSEVLGTPVRAFAYPYCRQSAEVRRCAAKHFDVAFGCKRGLNTRDTDRYLLRRSEPIARHGSIDLASQIRLGFTARDAVVSIRSRLPF
jgi:peptidoglycan/xylan/chitin deacetylase (PgdA/CDA1 family)